MNFHTNKMGIAHGKSSIFNDEEYRSSMHFDLLGSILNKKEIVLPIKNDYFQLHLADMGYGSPDSFFIQCRPIFNDEYINLSVDDFYITKKQIEKIYILNVLQDASAYPAESMGQ